MKKALLVGINYVGMQSQLQGCIEDTMNMKEVLMGKYGFSEGNIVMLNENISTSPTFSNIIDGIRTLVQDVKAGDTLIFHYSGHGLQVPDRSNDDRDGFDEAIAPLDYNTAGFITDDIIKEELINKIPTDAKLVAFFDCCHSGTITDLQWNFAYVDEAFESWTENKVDVTGDVAVFSGCLDVQVSADACLEKKSQGAFTYCLLKALEESDYDIANYILLENLNKELNTYGFEQKAQFSCSLMSTFEGKFSM